MANVTVIGGQWGDEGKGKIVDWLASRADVVARFQGGHNAGHTLVIDRKTYKLSLLPSGVVRPNKLSVIGNGVVLDPGALIEEIARLGSQGIAVTPDTLRIAENVALILPLHRDLEAIRESGDTRIGTTFRDGDGQVCRTFDGADVAGFACRDGGAWRIEMLAPGSGRQASGYQQATSGAMLVLQAAQERMAGEPVGEDEERRLREAGWR